jgi:hypothetical protein
MKIGRALQDALLTGRLVRFNENGEREELGIQPVGPVSCDDC